MTGTAYLGVEASLTRRRWVGPAEDLDRAAQALAQQTGLEPLLCTLLAARGVKSEEVPAFLSPTLRELMPDPSSLRDMDKAVDRFCTAVGKREKIAVFADYDVDGAASAALLIDWLRQMGMAATLYVPDRLREGYGPNDAAMAGLARDHDLIICVDCGTVADGPIAVARDAGADVIVLDHHLGVETLPPALAVVNPNRQDEDSPLTYLCAAGVVFMMLVAANRVLRGSAEKLPDLIGLLDLVALATVADVAPLQGLNRAFVRQGLKVMAERRRPGLRCLSDVAGLDSAPTPYHLGYMLGPRVNAGGRIGAADIGTRLLASTDDSEAQALAERLDGLNRDRREIEAQVLEAALAQAEERGLDRPLVWAAAPGWHPGVVGIVAARLKEAANRPAVVIGIEDGVGKGSGRSVSGIDLGAAVATVTREGLFATGGGHKMAAGMSVEEAGLEAAMARLSDLLARQGAAELGHADLKLDGMIAPAGASIDLIEALEQAGPFGAGAPAPRVVLPAQPITYAKRVGTAHLSFACGSGSARIQGICFGAFDGPLGPALEQAKSAPFHLAGRLEIDDWGGRRKVKLRLEDAAPA